MVTQEEQYKPDTQDVNCELGTSLNTENSIEHELGTSLRLDSSLSVVGELGTSLQFLIQDLNVTLFDETEDYLGMSLDRTVSKGLMVRNLNLDMQALKSNY